MTKSSKNRFTSDSAMPSTLTATSSNEDQNLASCLNAHSKDTRAAFLLAILFSVLMLITVLLSAVELTVYAGTDWFQKEYEKYYVLEDVRGEMSMESALRVTDEMMQYLKGNRKDLVVMITIDGKQQEFFSQREKDHLRDCQGLFLLGFRIRNFCGIASLLVLIVALRNARKRSKNGLVFTRTVPRASVVILLSLLTVGLIVARDFDRYFVVFHHIFFDNELWLLDPSEDNLINLLPEGFFVDTAGHILLLALGMTMLIAGIFFLLSRRLRRKDPYSPV